MKTVQNYEELQFMVATGVAKDIEDAEHILACQANEVVVEIPEVKIEFVQERHDRGYKVKPRHNYVFIRSAPKDHPVRDIFPKSEHSDQDVGWIHASVVGDLPQGTLVSYDMFSAIGGGMQVVDDTGESVYVMMVDEAAISAILEEKKVQKEANPSIRAGVYLDELPTEEQK
jgi:hypothetical protein